MMKILDFFKKAGIPNPPWDYDFIYNLDEREYPKYLAKIFKLNTGEDIDLTPPKQRHSEACKSRRIQLLYNRLDLSDFVLKMTGRKNKPNFLLDSLKTFNQKIQWLKLYDASPLKKLCTDKVTVRDYVKEKIGAEYLKPALQIITKDKFYINYSLIQLLRGISRSNPDESGFSAEPSPCPSPLSGGKQTNDMQIFNYPVECESLFDKIDFDSLPCSFVMKCSHGCKWQYIIKDKEAFLKNKGFFEIVRRQMTGWLEQEFWVFGGFEMQYKGLEPKIIIEPLMRDKIDEPCREIMVYCFGGSPKIGIKLHKTNNEITIYDSSFNIIDNIFGSKERIVYNSADENVKLAFELSKGLSKTFIFVRADWMIYQNKLYFEELTFTPYSGFYIFKDSFNNRYLGSMLDLRKTGG